MSEDVLGQIDVVFVIDSTGSMAAYIDEAKRVAREEAKRIANLGNLDINLGLVAYRDHPPQDTTFVTSSTKGFKDFDYMLSHMAASGGGDRPEAVWDGIDAAINFPWRDGADHLIFLIGDSPPHGYDDQRFGDNWPQGCPCGLTSAVLVQRLNEKFVKVNAHCISGEADTARAFEELTKGTNGECTVVNNPHQATASYRGTLLATSTSVADSRITSEYYTAHPMATDAEAAVDLDWDVSRITATNSYMNLRGLDKTGKKKGK